MMVAYAQRPYRRGVGMMLLNEHDQVFVGQRIDQAADAWQMPQGGIDDGEDARTAAIRELTEEIGTDKAEIIAESRDWYSYDLPPVIADKAWRGRFRGQTQKWFLLRFLGDDSDIRVSDVEHPEFETWKWAPIDRLMAVIVPFKRDIYAQVIAEFEPLVR